MKQILFVALLFMLSSALLAQKGLFELSYGDSLAYCDSLLTALGMQTKDKSGNVYVYYPLPESQYEGKLARINLYLSKETGLLLEWVAYILYSKTSDLEKDMVAKMKTLHGEKFEVKYDDFYRGQIYTWTLDSRHFVEIGTSGDVFHVWYRTK